jgi:hypothetical protein
MNEVIEISSDSEQDDIEDKIVKNKNKRRRDSDDDSELPNTPLSEEETKDLKYAFAWHPSDPKDLQRMKKVLLAPPVIIYQEYSENGVYGGPKHIMKRLYLGERSAPVLRFNNADLLFKDENPLPPKHEYSGLISLTRKEASLRDKERQNLYYLKRVHLTEKQRNEAIKTMGNFGTGKLGKIVEKGERQTKRLLAGGEFISSGEEASSDESDDEEESITSCERCGKIKL